MSIGPSASTSNGSNPHGGQRISAFTQYSFASTTYMPPSLLPEPPSAPHHAGNIVSRDSYLASNNGNRSGSGGSAAYQFDGHANGNAARNGNAGGNDSGNVAGGPGADGRRQGVGGSGDPGSIRAVSISLPMLIDLDHDSVGSHDSGPETPRSSFGPTSMLPSPFNNQNTQDAPNQARFRRAPGTASLSGPAQSQPFFDQLSPALEPPLAFRHQASLFQQQRSTTDSPSAASSSPSASSVSESGNRPPTRPLSSSSSDPLSGVFFPCLDWPCLFQFLFWPIANQPCRHHARSFPVHVSARRPSPGSHPAAGPIYPCTAFPTPWLA